MDTIVRKRNEEFNETLKGNTRLIIGYSTNRDKKINTIEKRRKTVAESI